MKIVVDGINGSGKSTLIESLKDKYNLSVYWAGLAPKNDIEAIKGCEYQLGLDDYILDRATCISHLCYQDVDKMSTSHYNKVLHYLSLMKKQCIFIHCVGNGTHIIKPYYTAEHLSDINKNKDTLKSKYDLVFKKVNHFSYDFNVKSLDDVYDYINLPRGK